MAEGDAPFVLELLNDAAFIRHIGDKGVRSEADAVAYVEAGPRASYARHGFGLLAVERRDTGEAIGICGLLKRDALPEPDLGFAYLERARGQGFAEEAARAVLRHAGETLGLSRILAITSPDNEASIGLLRKLGFRFAGMARMAEGDAEVRLYARTDVAT
jgi:RimJ/RimL family protein N-acetyltransferase